MRLTIGKFSRFNRFMKIGISMEGCGNNAGTQIQSGDGTTMAKARASTILLVYKH